MKQVYSNLVIVWVDPTLCSISLVLTELASGNSIQVRALEWTKTELRLAFHCNISPELAEAANKKVEQVINKLLVQ